MTSKSHWLLPFNENLSFIIKIIYSLFEWTKIDDKELISIKSLILKSSSKDDNTEPQDMSWDKVVLDMIDLEDRPGTLIIYINDISYQHEILNSYLRCSTHHTRWLFSWYWIDSFVYLFWIYASSFRAFLISANWLSMSEWNDYF